MSDQTGKLIARMAENVPELTSAQRQVFINDPNRVKEALCRAFYPSLMLAVTTEGQSAIQLLGKLERMGHRVDTCTTALLNSEAFKRTKDETYLLAIIPANDLTGLGRTFKTIQAEPSRRGFESTIPIELIPYIQMTMPNQRLRNARLTSLVVMHELVKSPDSTADALGSISVINSGQDYPNVYARQVFPHSTFQYDYGFIWMITHMPAADFQKKVEQRQMPWYTI